MSINIFIVLHILTICNIILHFQKINHNIIRIPHCQQCISAYINPMRSLSLNYLHNNKKPQKLSRSNSEDILNKNNKYRFDITKNNMK